MNINIGENLNELFKALDLEVLQKKEFSLKNLNSEISNLKSRVKGELDRVCSLMKEITLRVENKVNKILAFYEESVIKNYNGFIEMSEKLKKFTEKNSEISVKSKSLKFLQVMREILLEQNQEIPKYTSYEEVNHSFHQVISIMRKSFDLFEEHFVDLLSFGELKDISDIKIQQNIYESIEKDYSSDRTVSFLDSSSFEIVFEKEIDPQHEYNLNSLVMLNDDMIVSSSIDRSIHVYSLEKEAIVSSLNCMKFSPMVMCLLKTKVIKGKVNSINKIIHLKSDFDDNCRKSQGPFMDTETCLVATGGGDYDPNIYVWNIKNGKKILSLPGHTRHITTIAQLPDYNFLASGGYDNKIFIWDLNAGEPKLIINRHTFWIFKIKISHNKTYMASCSWDRTIILWKIIYDKQFENEYKFTDLLAEKILDAGFEVCTINFSFNFENLLISGDIGKNINVWNISTGKIKKELKLKEGFANELMLLEKKNSYFHGSKRKDFEGIFLITTSIDDNCLRIFSLEKGEEIMCLHHEILNLNAYNLNPKMQFMQFENGELGLINISHNDKIMKMGLWRIKQISE